MIVATGAQGEAIQKLHQMVAASSAFQERVKTYGQGETEAGKYVFSPYLDDPEQAVRPFAVIRQGNLQWYSLAGGKGNSMKPRGTLKLILADNAQQVGSDEAAEVDFRNFVDAVTADLADMSGDDDHLNINAINETEPPALSNPATTAANFQATRPYYICEYEIEWDAI